jgi:hypothetical protein
MLGCIRQLRSHKSEQIEKQAKPKTPTPNQPEKTARQPLTTTQQKRTKHCLTKCINKLYKQPARPLKPVAHTNKPQLKS